jgi:hypothetical protein
MANGSKKSSAGWVKSAQSLTDKSALVTVERRDGVVVGYVVRRGEVSPNATQNGATTRGSKSRTRKAKSKANEVTGALLPT